MVRKPRWLASGLVGWPGKPPGLRGDSFGRSYEGCWVIGGAGFSSNVKVIPYGAVPDIGEGDDVPVGQAAIGLAVALDVADQLARRANGLVAPVDRPFWGDGGVVDDQRPGRAEIGDGVDLRCLHVIISVLERIL